MVEGSVLETCQKRGISRRRFMEFCAAMATTLALPPSYAQVDRKRPQSKEEAGAGVAGVSGLRRKHGVDAAHQASDRSRIWCWNPSPGSTTRPSWPAYGKAAEAALNRVVREEKGKYMVVVEGAIPTADGGVYCTIGGRTALDIAQRSLRQRRGQHCGGRVRLGRWPGSLESQPYRRLGAAGCGARRQSRQSAGLPA